jgi:hypothetical protein
MKKKIALAMAAVMAFGSVMTVPFTAQASSVVRVSRHIDTGTRARGNGTILSAAPETRSGIQTHVENQQLRPIGSGATQAYIRTNGGSGFSALTGNQGIWLEQGGQRRTLASTPASAASVANSPILVVELRDNVDVRQWDLPADLGINLGTDPSTWMDVNDMTPTQRNQFVQAFTRTFEIELSGAEFMFLHAQHEIGNTNSNHNFDTRPGVGHVPFGEINTLHWTRTSQIEHLYTGLFHQGHLGIGTPTSMVPALPSDIPALVLPGPTGGAAEVSGMSPEWVQAALRAGLGYTENIRGNSLAYTITMSYINPRSVSVTVFLGVDGVFRNDIIQIPIVGYTTGSGGVTATIRDTGRSFVTGQTGINLVTGAAVVGETTVTTVGGMRTAGDGFVIRNNTIVITEPLAGVISTDAAFIIEAPAGFEFAMTENASNIANVAVWDVHTLGHRSNGETVTRAQIMSPVAATINATPPPTGATGTVQMSNNGVVWEEMVPNLFGGIVAPAVRPLNSFSSPVANISLDGFGDGAWVRFVSYASVGRTTNNLINSENFEFPQREVRLEAEGGERAVDRTRLVIAMSGLNSASEGRAGTIAISGLTLVPSSATLMNPDSLTGTEHFFTIIGSTYNQQVWRTNANESSQIAIDRRGIGTHNNVEGFALPGLIGQGITVRRQTETGGMNQSPARGGQNSNDASVIIEERSLNAWNLFLPISFTLVDAAGNPLTDRVRLTDVVIDNIHGVDYTTNNTTFQENGRNVMGAVNTVNWNANNGRSNTVQEAAYVNSRANLGIYGNHADFEFSQDGSSVTFWRNFRLAQDNELDERLAQRFRFGISAHPQFEGPVYVMIHGPAVDGLIQGSNVVRIHNIVPRLRVEAETTIVGIGHQVIPVADITVTELGQNNWSVNDVVNFSITEFGTVSARTLNGFRFNPISMENVSTSAGLTVSIANHQGNHLGIRVLGKTGGNNSSITLSGVTIGLDHTIPQGFYGLAVTSQRQNGAGEIQNNFNLEHVNLNDRPGFAISASALHADNINNAAVGQNNGQGGAGTHQYRLDRFNWLGYQVENFIQVGTPGQTIATTATTVTFNIAAGNSVAYVNGVATPIMSHGVARPILNVDGRTLLPIRAVAYFMGAQSHDLFMAPSIFQGHIVDTTVVNLHGRTVMFHVGTAWYTVEGMHFMMPDGVATIIHNDVTYVPFRGFGNAFGIPVYFDRLTNQAWFNCPQNRVGG